MQVLTLSHSAAADRTQHRTQPPRQNRILSRWQKISSWETAFITLIYGLDPRLSVRRVPTCVTLFSSSEHLGRMKGSDRKSLYPDKQIVRLSHRLLTSIIPLLTIILKTCRQVLQQTIITSRQNNVLLCSDILSRYLIN